MSLYVITALEAPVAVVFHRANSKWWSISRWDLAVDRLERGACLRGTLYPRRCDLSPDGRLLCYLALKGGRGEFVGQSGVKTFSAVSKMPWLFALAAWAESGTYTRGCHFVRGQGELGEPQSGDAKPMLRTFGLTRNAAIQYANERRRGWVEHADSPPRGANDLWDERRCALLTKPRPGKAGRLVLRDQGIEFNSPGRIEGRRPLYSFEHGRRRIELPEATWADWDQRGRLLLATEGGALQVRDPDSPALSVLWEHELGRSRPTPRPAPDWAQTWSDEDRPRRVRGKPRVT